MGAGDEWANEPARGGWCPLVLAGLVAITVLMLRTAVTVGEEALRRYGS